MNHLQSDTRHLRTELLEMWNLVQSQVEKANLAITNLDYDIAREILFREKMVDVYELKIDRDCEHFLGLLTPVAIDLRFALSVLKINSNLERIGDFAKGIAKFLLQNENKINKELIATSQVTELLNNAVKMLADVRIAFETEDTVKAISVFSTDEALDAIVKNVDEILANYGKAHLEELVVCFGLANLIRKIERIGDHSKNIAEELIFYIDAKVIKHSKQKIS